MRHLTVLTTSAVLFVALAASAIAAPTPKTLVAVLTAEQEVPVCAAAPDFAGGLAIFHIRDEEAGVVDYTLVANNLPGTTVAAHIHIGQRGQSGGIVQGLFSGASTDNGVLVRGTFTNPAVVTAILADPEGYYVNVHSSPSCGPGAVRGQLGEKGPGRTAE